MPEKLITFGAFDYAVIIAYFVFVLGIGFHRKNSASGQKEDFLLAGRSLTLPMFVSTLVATWYGNILGVGEFVYRDGLVGWVCFSFTYYVAALLFALFISRKVRSLGATSIPEQIEQRFGRVAGIISSIIVLFITLPAVYVLLLGVVVQLFTGWSLPISIIVSALLTFTYIYKGGFKANVATNSFQFVLMYVGFALLLVFSIMNFGSPLDLASHLPATHTTFTGTYGLQYVLVWFIIAFQTFVDPGFHQRCASARTPNIARNGVLISILFWMLFDFMTLTTALYAKAYLPEIAGGGLMSYPALSQAVLPAVCKGIFMVTIIATVMSTLSSYAFLSGATLGNDIIGKLMPKSKISSVRLMQIGLLISGISCIILAIAIPSAVDLIYKTASIAVPGLFFPLLTTYSKRLDLSHRNAIIIMLASSLSSLVWTICGMLGVHCNFIINDLFIAVEPMLPGIIISVLLGVLLIKKKDLANV